MKERMLLAELETRARADFDKRWNRLADSLAKTELSALEEAFTLDEQSCYLLFGISNKSLGGLESLYSLLVNCLLDDGTLAVKVTEEMPGYVFHKFTWGRDDGCGVTESTVLAAIKLKKAQKAFGEKYKEDIDDRNDMNKVREYFAFNKPLDDLFYKNCDVENKEKWDQIKVRKEKMFKRLKKV